MIFCIYCGQKLPDEAQFCMKCGQKLAGATDDSVRGPEKEKQMVKEDHALLHREEVLERELIQKKIEERLEIAFLVPTTDNCKKYNIPTTYSRILQDFVIRREGYDTWREDKYYPKKSDEDVKATFLSKVNIEAEYNGKKIPLSEFQQIGPYCVCDRGIFYEKNGELFFMDEDLKQRKWNRDWKLGIQEISYENHILSVSFFMGIRQTAYEQHSDICGGYGEQWTDIYQADIKTRRGPVDL